MLAGQKMHIYPSTQQPSMQITASHDNSVTKLSNMDADVAASSHYQFEMDAAPVTLPAKKKRQNILQSLESKFS